MPTRKRTSTRRRKMRGGITFEGQLKRDYELYFRSKTDDQYREISERINADSDLSDRYTSEYADSMVVVREKNGTPRAWIYNTGTSGYMMIDEEIDYDYNQLSDMALIYARFLA